MKHLFLYSFILIICLISCNDRSENSELRPDGFQKKSGNPVYVIDNGFWGISSSRQNSRATTDGINHALAAAKAQGYTHIKLAPGEYQVQCTGNNRWVIPTDGILVPSGITLDLTDTKIYLEPNDYICYGVIQLYRVSDVTIIGGHLVGDRYEHDFTNQQSRTHEYGHGINIQGSSNITIKDMKIEGMTGDAIILTANGSNSFQENREQSCRNVLIDNCRLYDCRRQGISVVNAVDVEIRNNVIYNIHGTNPQFGIDVEPEVTYGAVAERIIIHHNQISDCVGGISFHGGTDSEAYENDIQGLCLIAVFSQRVKIYRNRVTGPGYISAGRGSAERPCQDICIAMSGESANVAYMVNNSIQTGNFDCSYE